MWFLQRAILGLSVLLACIELSSVSAQTTAPVISLDTETPGGLGQYLEPVFDRNMERLHIPGAVFVMVKDGAVFFEKGYGFADLKAATGVDPERSVFRVASVSKLLTVTAVMQLHERGLLDLHEDVNTYLSRFVIPPTFPKPVTLEHLITHTAGFDDQRIGLATLTRANLDQLGEFLARRLPPRVRPPGVEYAYSRYGIALAGYLVEVVSGKPFADYVEENILAPLGMEHSSFEQHGDSSRDMSHGHIFASGEYAEVPFYYFNTAPEASLNATASDMARFMIAHLQLGVYGDVRILNPETAELMHSRQFAHHPLLPGLGYGFYERHERGQRILQHGGHIPGFVSRLLLFPDLNIGVFMACNNDRFALLSRVTDALFERYFPESTSTTDQKSLSPVDLAPFAGSYRINTYSHNSVEKVFSINQQFNIKETSHALEMKGGQLWRPVGANVFRKDGSGEISAFRLDSAGQAVRWFRKRFSFEKVPFFETLTCTLWLMGVFCLSFAAGVVGWIRPARWQATLLTGSANQLTMRFIGLVSIPNLLFLFGLGLLLYAHDRIDEFTFGVPWSLVVLLCLPLVSAVLTISAVVNWIGQLRSGGMPFRDASFFAGFLIVSCAFILFLNQWNLLGFRF